MSGLYFIKRLLIALSQGGSNYMHSKLGNNKQASKWFTLTICQTPPESGEHPTKAYKFLSPRYAQHRHQNSAENTLRIRAGDGDEACGGAGAVIGMSPCIGLGHTNKAEQGRTYKRSRGTEDEKLRTMSRTNG
jgi:hypothetical protein